MSNSKLAKLQQSNLATATKGKSTFAAYGNSVSLVVEGKEYSLSSNAVLLAFNEGVHPLVDKIIKTARAGELPEDFSLNFSVKAINVPKAGPIMTEEEVNNVKLF